MSQNETVQLGPYELQGELGRGGCGIVFRGRAPDGRTVAVKTLLRNERSLIERFDRERRLLGQFGEEDGFVALLDSGMGPRGPYLVMPFVAGGSLRDRMKNGPMPIEQALEIMTAIAEAVGRAHAQGIVHRDLKPENILFTEDGRPLVSDLGLAKHFSTDTPGASQSVQLSKTGEFRGTAGYMAPEQMQSAKDAGAPADVFALGVMLYECVTGQPAFDGDSLHTVLAKVASGTFTAVRELRPEAPRWLARAVSRAMALNAANRPQNGTELARALREGPDRARREQLLWILASAAAVVSLTVLAVIISRITKKGGAGGATPLPSPPALVATSTVLPVPRQSNPNTTPEWYTELLASERPVLPLAKGLAFGKAPGDYVNTKDGSVLRFVPRSTFRMGTSTEEGSFGPAHTVEVSAYFIGKLEVSMAEWAGFVKATGYKTAAEVRQGGILLLHELNQRTVVDETAIWKNPWGSRAPAPPFTHPVTQVDFADVHAYCTWAGLRLPTEAEWERAAGWDGRERKHVTHPWGDLGPESPNRVFANLADATVAPLVGTRFFTMPNLTDGFPRSAPCGSFPGGASPCRALDMAGNVEEWCEDAFDPKFYRQSPPRDPMNRETAATEGRRVVRGGHYLTAGYESQTACRASCAPLTREETIGFRVARNGF